MSISAIIPAAGSSTRINANKTNNARENTNKLLIKLNNHPILSYTINIFEKCPFIEEIILVAKQEDILRYHELIGKYNFDKVKLLIPGGKTRQESVYKGLAHVYENCADSYVVIHDGARPFVSKEIIEKSIEDAKKYGASVVAVSAVDTVKIADTNSDEKFIQFTPDRNLIWCVQTPQTFKTEIIKEAHQKALEDNFVGTDDSVLVERLGYKVKITQGDYRNMKITTSDDLLVAEAFLKEEFNKKRNSKKK